MIDYLEQARTINGAYNADKMRRLRQEIARKTRGKLTNTAPDHMSQVAMTAATVVGSKSFLTPTYSLDMTPSDF